MNGYITTTRKKHYIILTEKRHVTKYMLAAFLRKIAEAENIEPEKLRGSLTTRQAIAEMRKRVEPCRTEKRGDCWHIEVGKEKPHAILNCAAADVIEVSETRDTALLSEIFGN